MLTYTVEWRTESGVRMCIVFHDYITAQRQRNVIIATGRAATIHMADVNRMHARFLPYSRVIWQRQKQT